MEFLASLVWDISPEIFNFKIPLSDTYNFQLALRWYGLFFALGFVVGYQIMQKIYKIENKPAKDLESLTFTMIFATVAGARLGHCLFYAPEIYLADPIRILKVWEGGLASHGAAIGILFALYLYVKKRPQISYLWILDRIVIVIALAGAFIRLGNFFNSEIVGSPTDMPWGVVFTSYDELTRHPSQLYEAFSYLAIFIFLYSYYKKYTVHLKQGFLFGVFLVSVFGMRFLIEFIKEVQEPFEQGMILKMGQILSIPLIGIGIYFINKALKSK